MLNKSEEEVSTQMILPGEGMPRAHRNRNAPKTVKIGKAKRGKLSIGGLTLPVSAAIDVGSDGAIYLIPSLSVEKARALLKRVPKGQRGLRAEHVRALAGDMRKGRFRWTGEPLRLDARGMLIDGQHRLSAASQSRTALKNVVLIVVLKKGSIASIDEGVKRNIRDRRAILGKQVMEYAIYAAVAYEASPEWLSHSRRGMSNEMLDEAIDSLPWLDDIAGFHNAGRSTYKRIDSAMSAVAIRCMRKSRKEARLFFNAVSTNTHEINGKPCPQVRAACTHLMQMSAAYTEGRGEGDTRRRRTATTHKLIEAWNAWRSNKSLPSPWRTSGKIPNVI